MKEIIFPSLNLTEWRETRDRIHKYCRLVGAIREVLSEPLSKALHTNLLLCRKGITTSPLQRGDISSGQFFEVIIEMNRTRLCIESNYREPLHIALTGQSLNALCDETCSLLNDIGIKPPLERPSFLEGTRGKFDKDHVKAYWRALKSTNRIFKQIKLQLPGDSSPIQLHVDTLIFSLTWYCKEFIPGGVIEEIDFGFSTGDEYFPEAHFFIQSFPDKQAIKNFVDGKISGFYLNNNSKLILPYSKVVETARAEKILLDFYTSVFTLFRI
jgi:hypothetical protein